MSDGSTDSAILEQEMMYIRFCHKGVINVKFLEVAELERGTAFNIKAAIEKALIKVDTPRTPGRRGLRAFGARASGLRPPGPPGHQLFQQNHHPKILGALRAPDSETKCQTLPQSSEFGDFYATAKGEGGAKSNPQSSLLFTPATENRSIVAEDKSMEISKKK